MAWMDGWDINEMTVGGWMVDEWMSGNNGGGGQLDGWMDIMNDEWMDDG